MMPELESKVSQGVDDAARRARERKQPVLLSVSILSPCSADLLALLENVPAPDGYGFFWQQPVEGFAIAAIGAAALCTGHGIGRFAQAAAARDRILRDAVSVSLAPDFRQAGPLFVGGFAFDPESDVEGPWKGFPPGRLVLPRLLFAQRGEAAALTCNTMIDTGAVPSETARCVAGELARLKAAAAAQGNGGGEPASAARYQTSTARYEAAAAEPLPQWREAVAETIADIRAGRLRKLVLARGCTVRSERPFGCVRLVRRLRQGYPDCTTFWIRTPHGDFLGATPEVLASLSDGVVRTAAVAGSIGRGTTPDVDRALGLALLSSPKEREEHSIVVSAIESVLTPLCSSLEVTREPRFLDLDNVRHLVTPITGRLATPRDLLDLVARLHPTPAVAGYPCGAALEILRRRERFDRGWYAGPVGWTDASGEGEFVVALRSALVRGADALLYAGAGIVAGSDPDAEIAETRLKLQPMLSALLEL